MVHICYNLMKRALWTVKYSEYMEVSMQIKVKPLFILGREFSLVWQSDGSVEWITDEGTIQLKVSELNTQLRENVKSDVVLLRESVVRSESDIQNLRKELLEVDILLVYPMGPTSPHPLFRLGFPIIAFSGQYTPALALYTFGIERHSRPDVTIALDYAEVDQAIKRFQAKKKLQNSRTALFGFPASLFSQWHDWPELELTLEKLGVHFVPYENRELVERMKLTDETEAKELAEQWIQEAKDIVEPNSNDMIETARLYLTLSSILREMRANSMTISCLELIHALKVTQPCYALSKLQDNGITAACESDIAALLSMMILSYLAEKPALMGNIVCANPENNVIMISHCVVPTRMAGFDLPSSPYILRDYHAGGTGVTAHVELPLGQDVTVARLSRSLDKILILTGQLVDCRDTVGCRTTISIKVNDARRFVEHALGNHHAVVYGNHTTQATLLAKTLGIEALDI
jgi:L-fucose isomerase-like protein